MTVVTEAAAVSGLAHNWDPNEPDLNHSLMPLQLTAAVAVQVRARAVSCREYANVFYIPNLRNGK